MYKLKKIINLMNKMQFLTKINEIMTVKKKNNNCKTNIINNKNKMKEEAGMMKKLEKKSENHLQPNHQL